MHANCSTCGAPPGRACHAINPEKNTEKDCPFPSWLERCVLMLSHVPRHLSSVLSLIWVARTVAGLVIVLVVE